MPVEILDVHSNDAQAISSDLSEQIANGLSQPEGSKSLPTILLYDERGLRLYDDITTCASEYYLFSSEEHILKSKADEIVGAMHGGKKTAMDNEIVLDALRKTSHLLLGLSRLQPSPEGTPIAYYALDLEERELQRTLDAINKSNIGDQLRGKVDTKGMWGTYDDGLRFVHAGGLQGSGGPPSSEEIIQSIRVNKNDNDNDKHSIDERKDSSSDESRSSGSTLSSDSGPVTPCSSFEDSPGGGGPVHILFLGSSLGNFTRSDAASFLGSLPLRAGSGDTLLLGMDHDNPQELVELAYNDKAGYTKKFIMNGLVAAGRALGDESLFKEADWEYVNTYNTVMRQHEAFYRSKSKQVIKDPKTNIDYTFNAGEILKIEESFKFSEQDAYTLFTDANLRPIQRWSDEAGQYSLWLLHRPPFHFPRLNSPTPHPASNTTMPLDNDGPFGVPTLEEWKTLWKAWDFITLEMIPPGLLYKRPIDLRHICLFYIGHIPAFLDIQLAKVLGEGYTEPAAYKEMFERGIDPNVDDPSLVHDHSIVPTRDEDWPTLSYLLAYRDRVRERLVKVYDRIRADKDGVMRSRRLGRVLFMTYEHEGMHAETLLYMLMQANGETIAPPGFPRPLFESMAREWDAAPLPEERTVKLGGVTISMGHNDVESDDEGKGLGQHQYGWDNESPKRDGVYVGEFRMDWRPVTNGEFYDFYLKEKNNKEEGDVLLPASWWEDGKGEMFVRTFYGPIPLAYAQHWPVMAPYTSLSRYAIVKGGRLPTETELRLFMDQFHHGFEGGGTNVGFRNWHPVPATTGVRVSQGMGHNGGIWEWTSTVFEAHEGFTASGLYPGYSKDFFDGVHQVVLGGSYATIPRISERRTMRNWYQRNYPFAFIGGRVAYDS